MLSRPHLETSVTLIQDRELVRRGHQRYFLILIFNFSVPLFVQNDMLNAARVILARLRGEPLANKRFMELASQRVSESVS